MFEKIHFTHSPEETKAIAAQFLHMLDGGEVIGLEGDLGSGKTTFVQGLAEALGIEQPVRSPTYALMNVHDTDFPKINHLVHIDLYRLEDEQVTTDLELDEWLDRDDVLIVIEWPGRMDLQLTYKITLDYGKNPKIDRKIIITTG